MLARFVAIFSEGGVGAAEVVARRRPRHPVGLSNPRRLLRCAAGANCPGCQASLARVKSHYAREV